MPLSSLRLLFVLIAATTAGNPFASAARAAAPIGLAAPDALQVEQPWARASAGNATTGAAYVTLIGGTQPDRLLGATTEAATTADVHESISDNGVMKMRPLAAGLPVPPGQTVTLSPGAYHIMLTGLKQPLVAGHSFPLTLRFEHAQPVTVQVQVRAIGQTTSESGPMGDHEKMHMP